jgi:hypothetical protein
MITKNCQQPPRIGLGNRAIPACRLLRACPPALISPSNLVSSGRSVRPAPVVDFDRTDPGRGISLWTPHPPGERTRTERLPPRRFGYAVVPTSGCCSAVDPSITVGAALLVVMAILRGFAFSAMGIRRVSTPAS